MRIERSILHAPQPPGMPWWVPIAFTIVGAGFVLVLMAAGLWNLAAWVVTRAATRRERRRHWSAGGRSNAEPEGHVPGAAGVLPWQKGYRG